MDSPIHIIKIDQQNLNIRTDETLRYLGYKKELIKESDISMIDEFTDHIRIHMSPRGCYRRFSLEVAGDGNITMPYGNIFSKGLTKNLYGCEEIIFMAVTLGIGFDRALKKMSLTSITEAACYQSIGGSAVEALCEHVVAEINRELAAEDKKLRPRFSPGYSDFTLDNQRDIFRCLNPEKHIGVTLMDTLIMAPEKSVTAVIGIEKIEKVIK